MRSASSAPSYAATLKYLYALQYRGMKFGLRNTRRLLKAAGNPEKRFRSIHIAGTNGKGSTACMLASVLMESGYRTALYTSPHLLRFTERIRIDGVEIPEERLVRYIRALRPAIEAAHATFFEATTCAAFMYFAEEGVDVAVIETGLGGRLDATNTLLPMVSVITNVSFDHTEYLGDTLGKIAREKAGIIKRGIPAVTGAKDPVVLRTLRSAARKKGATLHAVADIAQIRRAKREEMGRRGWDLQTRRWHLPSVRLDLPGVHQADNALLAVAVLELMLRRRGARSRYPGIRPAAIRRGLGRVSRNTGIRGRMERISVRGRSVLLDVAHNPAGIHTLSPSLPAIRQGRLIVVFGVMRDKDYRTMAEELAGFASIVVAVAPKMKRSLSVAALAGTGRRLGANFLRCGSVADGVDKALRIARKSDTVLVTGSHFVVGEALAHLERECP